MTTKPLVMTALASGALFTGGWMVGSLGATVSPTGNPPGLEAHETHGSTSLLGQFRTSFSSWLWVRTDLYLHHGVEMRALTDQERRSGVQGVGSVDNRDNALHDDDAHVSVIPTADHDFRGLFGDLERATSAWKDMRGHDHADPISALPLFRLMTWADPQFIPGWTTASNVIARDRSDEALEKALRLLREGLGHNPNSVALNQEIGQMLASRRRDFAGALHYLEAARRLALRSRSLDEDDLEALRGVYRWLGMLYRDIGRDEERRAVLSEGKKVFPDDVVIARLLDPPKPEPVSREEFVAREHAHDHEDEDHHDHDHHDHGH